MLLISKSVRHWVRGKVNVVRIYGCVGCWYDTGCVLMLCVRLWVTVGGFDILKWCDCLVGLTVGDVG